MSLREIFNRSIHNQPAEKENEKNLLSRKSRYLNLSDTEITRKSVLIKLPAIKISLLGIVKMQNLNQYFYIVI